MYNTIKASSYLFVYPNITGRIFFFFWIDKIFDGMERTDDYQEPLNAQVISLLLSSMGIKAWEPRVVPQLLEFLHCYVSEVLLDSQDYAAHAGRTNIELNDVRLTIESRLDKGSRPPSRQELIRLARRKNQQTIPPLPYKVPGVSLPPDEYCLTKENYQVLSDLEQTSQPPTMTRSLYQ